MASREVRDIDLTKYNFGIDIHLVDHCNLNCISCFHCAPLAKPWFYDIENFELDLKQLRTFLPKTTHIKLMGGEPLLHPLVLDFCKIAKQYFSNVMLVTNGILLKNKSETFFQTINKLNILVEWPNYYNDMTIKKIVSTKFSHYLISERDHMGNPLFNFKSKRSYVDAFNNCSMGGVCMQLYKGFIYRCCMECYANNILVPYFNLKLPINYNLEENRFNISNGTYEKFLEFILKPSTFCSYCIGASSNPEEIQGNTSSEWTTSKKELSEWVEKI